MTNTDTSNVEKTSGQIIAGSKAGSELVRITVNNDKSAKAVPKIIEAIKKNNFSTPVIGDFHYNGHSLLTKYPECAQALAKYRINPGNVDAKNRDKILHQLLNRQLNLTNQLTDIKK